MGYPKNVLSTHYCEIVKCFSFTWSFQILDFFNSKPKKDRFLGLMWKKEHQSGFCRSWHFGRSGVEKSVQKAFKKRSKPFGSVLELKKAFWSGNNRSGVLFLLNLAKLIDFGFGVEISTIKRIQVLIIIILMIII